MNNIPLIGYVDPLSGRPGDTLEFKVSCESGKNFEASIVKVICADPNPDGPGILEKSVECELSGICSAKAQPLNPGSCAISSIRKIRPDNDSFSVCINFWSSIQKVGLQTILSLNGTPEDLALALCIDAEHHLSIVSGNDREHQILISLPGRLELRTWYRGFLTWNSIKSELTLGIIPIHFPENGCSKTLQCAIDVTEFSTIAVAAMASPLPRLHFNGKLESPALYSEALTSEVFKQTTCLTNPALISHWDFSHSISSTKIVDTGKEKNHGSLVNFPVRAVMGSNWSGSERNWKHRPEEYGAIYFHDDDLYDAGWETSFKFTIPQEFDSGIYAAKIKSGEWEDNIPFFVCPAKNKPRSRLCLLVSTFTYVIYGNHARPDFETGWLEHSNERNAYPWNPAEFPQYGLSTYNVHSDGSGICHASHRRPLINMKSGYITFGNTSCSGLRHFQADSHLVTWLEHQGIEFDIITDQQLNDEGLEAIKGYHTLVTGSHPEYHTPDMLDALMDYRGMGGNFVYLGGNGFYWKIAEHPESPGTLEVRRAEGGIRAWAAEPGEYYQAFDGQYGGLWRRNNRPPQQLAEIGFSAQGKFTGSWYRRTPESYTDTEVAFIFQGIQDEILGDFGLCGYGAAGFELDRVDFVLGSDKNTVVLARSENHDSDFVLVPEEQLTHITNLPGEPAENLIRADMVYHRNGEGSKLFSTGSITFCGSLMINDGDNNISRLLRNVLDNFLQE